MNIYKYNKNKEKIKKIKYNIKQENVKYTSELKVVSKHKEIETYRVMDLAGNLL